MTLHRRQQHVGQTETRCFDLSGHGVTLPARLSFTYSSFIELLFFLTRVVMVATSPACHHCRMPHFSKSREDYGLAIFSSHDSPDIQLPDFWPTVCDPLQVFKSGLKLKEGYDGTHKVF